jgi:preprotein translocase subunit SecG
MTDRPFRAAPDGIEVMQTVIIVVHLMIVLAMIGLVLLQKSEGGGLGMGGGGGFMTSRGSANVLSRATAILAGSFFVTSLFLSILAGMDRKPSTLINSAPAGAPAPGGLPPASQGGGLLDQLKGPAPQPGAPSGPQVPQSK